MAKPYALVVFDWEGTLGDTLGLILNVVGTVAEELGLEKPEPETAMACAGYGLVNALRKLYPELTEQEQQTLLNQVQTTLMKRHDEVFLFPGALAMIKNLHAQGIDLAIATNKGEKSLQRALQQTGLSPYFSVTRSAGQAAAKPDPEMLQQILEVSGHKAEEALMVGDSTSDIEMAGYVQMDAIALDFYHQQNEALQAKGALAVFDNYEDVTAFIMRSRQQEKL